MNKINKLNWIISPIVTVAVIIFTIIVFWR